MNAGVRLVGALSFLVLSARHAAAAATIALFAEAATIPPGSDCTYNQVNASPYSYMTIRCPDAGTGGVIFTLPGLIPKGTAYTPNVTFTAKIDYYGSTSSSQCAWRLRVLAIDRLAGATGSLLGVPDSTTVGDGQDVWSVQMVRTSTTLYNTTYQSNTAGIVYTVGPLTGTVDACNLERCTDTSARIFVELDRSRTTSSVCDFRTLVMDIP